MGKGQNKNNYTTGIAESAVFCVSNGATGAKNSTRGHAILTPRTRAFTPTLINQMPRVSNYVIIDAKKTRFVNGILTYIWYEKGLRPLLYYKYVKIPLESSHFSVDNHII